MNELPFAVTVSDLLEERDWSQRRLCVEVGVDCAHMSRLLRRRAVLTPTPELMVRVAEALDVPPQHFREYREWRVLEEIRRDPGLREQLFTRLVARSPTVLSTYS